MPENKFKTITIDGKDYSYEGRFRIAGKTKNELTESVAEKFPSIPNSERLKIVDFLLNTGKEKPVVKPVALAVITSAQLKDTQTYCGMTSADLAEVVKVIQGVITEKTKADKADNHWHKVALTEAKKLGITPEELKKRFSELDQFDAANK